MPGDNDAPELADWHRLSPWAVAFLFIRGIARFARENMPLLLGAGAGAALLEAIGLVEVVLALGVLLLIAGLIALRYYQRFRFRLDDDVLVVQKGLVERSELKVSAGRVQHLAIDQPAYMRPFDVVRFSVDTPGGMTTEVELPGIPRPRAELLRRALQTTLAVDAQAPGAVEPETAEQETVLFQVTARGLTLHGLASNHAYLLAAALAPVLQPLERYLRRHLTEPGAPEWLRPLLENPALVLVIAIPSLLGLLLASSVAFAWLRYFRFQLTRSGDRFIQRSGLLSRREKTLSAPRLQSVEWAQTAVGRLLGRGYLICKQYGGTPDTEVAGQSFIVPGLQPARADELSRAFWPGLSNHRSFRPVHRFYRRLLALRLGLLSAGVLGLLAAVQWEPAWLLGLLILPALAWLPAHLRWRAVGWQRAGDYLRIRRGLLARRTTLFPLANTQSVTFRQSWFQKRRDLASLQFALASGPVVLPYIRATHARALANAALLHAELSPSLKCQPHLRLTE